MRVLRIAGQVQQRQRFCCLLPVVRHFPDSYSRIRNDTDPQNYFGRGAVVEVGLDTLTNRGVGLTFHDFIHHLLIAGATGSGKSMLLEHLCRRIIVHRSLSAKNGGLIVFDPHWSFAPGLIDYMAMMNLRVPLLVIDFDSPDVVAFDPLQGADIDQLDMLGAWVAHLWERQGNSRAPRLSAGITRVAHALREAHATLAEAYDLLNPLGGNREIRRAIVARIKDSSLRSEWNAHLEANNRYFELIMGSTERAVAPLVDSLPKRWSCGQNVSFKFEDALNEGWIVLIGAGRSSGSHAQATLMLDSLWHAAIHRKKCFPPMHLVIDEFAEVLSPAVVPLLPQSRKFNLSVTLATQSPSDLSGLGPSGKQVFNAILHSARSKIAFQLDGDGARVLAGPLRVEAKDIERLPRRHAIVRTMTEPQTRTFITDDVPNFHPRAQRVKAYVDARMQQWRGLFVFDREEARRRYEKRRHALIATAEVASAICEPDDYAIPTTTMRVAA